MPIIRLHTHIKAPAKVVFNLSRSVDLHTLSTIQTKEKAIAGRTTGLMECGETVTWEAQHLGFTQKLSSKITVFNSYENFTDEMIEGVFKRFRHEHVFKYDSQSSTTIMTDIFDYESPLGWLGKLADILFLERYMIKFLKERNHVIKEFAENSDKYNHILDKH